MQRVIEQPAYILHSYAYRETSLLLEIFTRDYGRLSVLAKGVRQAKSNRPALLQIFSPLFISWAGRSELKTLTAVELRQSLKSLQGACLFAGFYLNELLIYLLQKWDAYPILFQKYEESLALLQTAELKHYILRSFEKTFLAELGYSPLPKNGLHHQLLSDQYYQFIYEQGLVPVNHSVSLHSNTLFLGKYLLAMVNEDWQEEQTLKEAKRLTRLVLAPLLGAKEIKSRELFMGFENEK